MLLDNYDNPTKLLNETFTVHDGNHYDDPTCLDLVSNRDKTAVIGRVEGEDSPTRERDALVGCDK